jgi:hypothetical protein
VVDRHQSLIAPDEAAVVEPYRLDVASAKAASVPETWERAWAEGEAMSLDEAADYAVSGR